MGDTGSGKSSQNTPKKLVLCELLKINQFFWVKAELMMGFFSHCLHKETVKQMVGKKLQDQERVLGLFFPRLFMVGFFPLLPNQEL